MAEAVPVVDVMSGNSNSMLEGLALANGGCGGFGGGNGALWILFLLVALGGGNFGGWGGRNALGADLAATTAEAVAENKAGLNYIGQATAAQGVKLDNIIAGQYQNTINLSNAICQLGYQDAMNFASVQQNLAACCCSVKQEIAQAKYDTALQFAALTKQIADEGCATRSFIAAQHTADVERELQDYKLKVALAEQANSCNNCCC